MVNILEDYNETYHKDKGIIVLDTVTVENLQG